MNPQLVSYIKENLTKGYTKIELKEILKEHGWTELEIDEAYEFLFKPMPKKSKKLVWGSPQITPCGLLDPNFEQKKPSQNQGKNEFSKEGGGPGLTFLI